MTAIQWTDRVWNPVIGCSRVSAGCTNCYAERDAARKSTNPKVPAYAGLASFTPGGPRWSGEVRERPEKLAEPLSWQKPQRVFVNSMSDLFHEDVPDMAIAAVFGVMAACQHMDFQVLTKRPERMRRWFALAAEQQKPTTYGWCTGVAFLNMLRGEQYREAWRSRFTTMGPWPLPNVHLGVSVEDQATADERIPILLDTPAAVRWVSAEPLLGPVDLRSPAAIACRTDPRPCWCGCHITCLDTCSRPHPHPLPAGHLGIDWVVVGGESGPGARACDIEWIRSVVRQCREPSVPVFVKQLGARVIGRDCEHGRAGASCGFLDRRGGDPAEWPDDLRWRQFPEVTHG